MFSFTLLLATLSASGPALCSPVGRRDFTVGGLVNTTSGTVQGKASELRPDVSAYLGIPYAQPPLGDLRFDAPQPFMPTGAVLNATQFVSQVLVMSHIAN
jgi:Carboxylesterase family